MTLVGFGKEMAQMNPEQLHYASDLTRVLTSAAPTWPGCTR